MAFAIRKVARRKEREEVATFREWRFAFVGVTQIGATTIRVDDRYKHMIAPLYWHQERWRYSWQHMGRLIHGMLDFCLSKASEPTYWSLFLVLNMNNSHEL
jgi:hypothetical protein